MWIWTGTRASLFLLLLLILQYWPDCQWLLENHVYSCNMNPFTTRSLLGSTLIVPGILIRLYSDLNTKSKFIHNVCSVDFKYMLWRIRDTEKKDQGRAELLKLSWSVWPLLAFPAGCFWSLLAVKGLKPKRMDICWPYLYWSTSSLAASNCALVHNALDGSEMEKKCLNLPQNVDWSHRGSSRLILPPDSAILLLFLAHYSVEQQDVNIAICSAPCTLSVIIIIIIMHFYSAISV